MDVCQGVLRCFVRLGRAQEIMPMASRGDRWRFTDGIYRYTAHAPQRGLCKLYLCNNSVYEKVSLLAVVERDAKQRVWIPRKGLIGYPIVADRQVPPGSALRACQIQWTITHTAPHHLHHGPIQ